MVILGKVSAIINSYVVALNIGRDRGVLIDMKFEILYTEIIVKDPDIEKELGKLRYTKARVKVIQVFDRFCLARSDEQVIKPIFPSFLIQQSKIKKLPIDEYLFDSDEKIKIGDSVRQIIEKS